MYPEGYSYEVCIYIHDRASIGSLKEYLEISLPDIIVGNIRYYQKWNKVCLQSQLDLQTIVKDQLPQEKCCSIAKPPAVVEQYNANACGTEDIPNISNSKRRKSLIEDKQVQIQRLAKDLKVVDSDRYNAPQCRLWAEAIIGCMTCQQKNSTNWDDTVHYQCKTINMEKLAVTSFSTSSIERPLYIVLHIIRFSNPQYKPRAFSAGTTMAEIHKHARCVHLICCLIASLLCMCKHPEMWFSRMPMTNNIAGTTIKQSSAAVIMQFRGPQRHVAKSHNNSYLSL